MRKWLLMSLLVLVMIKSHAQHPTEQAVIDSALQFYPKIIEAQQVLAGAEADYLSKQGLFDAKITAQRFSYASGVYDGQSYTTVEASKPLPFANASLFGSYSRSSDSVYPEPLNNNSNNTLSGGRAKLGISLSLLRDFLVNDNLVDLRISDIGIDIAAERLRLTQLSIVNQAKKAYYDYVTAYQNYRLVQDSLALRTDRLNQVTAQSEAGDKPKLAIIDSERSVLASESDLIDANQALVDARLKLSLYYRDSNGNRRIIPQPDTDEPVLQTEQTGINAITDPTRAVTQLQETRADIKIITFEIQQARESLALYETQLIPDLKLKMGYSNDFGHDTQDQAKTNLKQENRLNVDLTLSIPLETNKQRGLIQKTSAKIAALSQTKQLIQDNIAVDIMKVHAKIMALQTIYQNMQRQVVLSQALLDAETTRFNAGDSDIIMLNIREQSVLSSNAKLIATLNKLRAAIADYNFLLMQY